MFDVGDEVTAKDTGLTGVVQETWPDVVVVRFPPDRARDPWDEGTTRYCDPEELTT